MNENVKKSELVRALEKNWWEKLNPKYLQCQRDCKQSAMAEILFCSQYQKVEDKNDKE